MRRLPFCGYVGVSDEDLDGIEPMELEVTVEHCDACHAHERCPEQTRTDVSTEASIRCSPQGSGGDHDGCRDADKGDVAAETIQLQKLSHAAVGADVML